MEGINPRDVQRSTSQHTPPISTSNRTHTAMGPPRPSTSPSIPNTTVTSMSMKRDTSQGSGTNLKSTAGGAAGNAAVKKTSNRQTVSCAECKRLKLKCSRSWPCSSCVRRGCAQLCPTLSMVGGKGRRLILADTQELHERIADLEKALAVAHAKTSDQPHILLQTAYLFAPKDRRVPPPPSQTTPAPVHPGSPTGSHITELHDGDDSHDERDDNPNDEDDEGMGWNRPSNGKGKLSALDGVVKREPGWEPGGKVRLFKPEDENEALGEISLGTLTIGNDGEAQYVGNAAGSSFFHEGTGNLVHEKDDALFSGGAPSRSSWSPAGHHDITPGHLLGNFPFSDGGAGPGLHELWQMLPAWNSDPERAIQDGSRMVVCYFENVTWMYDPVPRPILDNDYLPSVYAKADHPPSPHKLACVYLIMALGVMFDLENREQNDPLADELARLGSLCLSHDSSLLRPTTASVQALTLLSLFLLNRFPEGEQGAAHTWPLLGISTNSITALGLHRNFTELSPFEQEERRKTLWEALTVERLQAMCFARPNLLQNRFIETDFPGTNVQNPDEKCQDASGYFAARYKIVHLIEKVIIEQTRISRGSYKTVLQIDEEIVAARKDWPAYLIPKIRSTSLPLPPDVHPHIMMQRFSIRMIFREARIYLHRTYFAKALQQHPEDPSSSRCKFGPSFLVVFESAVELLATVRQSLLYHQSLTSRWAFFHFHAYSAAICLAAVCIQAPNSAFASPAYMSLVLACDLAEAAVDGSTARSGLSVLQRLRHRASKAIVSSSKYNGGKGSGPSHMDRAGKVASGASSGQSTPAGGALSTSPGTDDDLSHLANRPHVKRVTTDHPSPLTSSTDHSAATTTTAQSPQELSEQQQRRMHTASQSPPSMPQLLPQADNRAHYLPGHRSEQYPAYDLRPHPGVNPPTAATNASWPAPQLQQPLEFNSPLTYPDAYNPLLYSGPQQPPMTNMRPNPLAGFDGYGMQPLLMGMNMPEPVMQPGSHQSRSQNPLLYPNREDSLNYNPAASPQNAFNPSQNGNHFFFDDSEFGTGVDSGDIDMGGVLEPEAGGFEDVERFIESLKHG